MAVNFGDDSDYSIDFGHIHGPFKPKAVESPGSIDTLVSTLKSYNASGTRVTVRNTAHSCNGQVLSKDVVLALQNLNSVKFNKGDMTVTVQPGASWDAALREIGFPKFCLPIFPSNPEQHIRVGGTAAVGGVGYYGSSVGGFWNQVVGGKLVTMRGDVIDCSRTQNFELLQYSLGGYGRIGILAEMTVKVVPSSSHVCAMILAYVDNPDVFFAHFQKAIADPFFNGVASQEDVGASVSSDLNLKLLTVIKEVEPGKEKDTSYLNSIKRYVVRNYVGGVAAFMQVKNSNVDISFHPTAFAKREIVYFSPQPETFWKYALNRVTLALFNRKIFKSSEAHEESNTAIKHPWTDCIVPLRTYREFMRQAKDLIRASGLAKRLCKQSVFHGVMNIDSYITFVMKRFAVAPNDFPLSLDLAGEDTALGLAIMPDVKQDELPAGIQLSKDLTDLVYKLGGKRYLYGLHDMTAAQVEQHFGASIITRWNQLKTEHDPKKLLNIGVIEHLDT